MLTKIIEHHAEAREMVKAQQQLVAGLASG
jgi:hypothetical protein